MRINFIEGYLTLFYILDDIYFDRINFNIENISFVDKDILGAFLGGMSPESFVNSISADPGELHSWVEIWNNSQVENHNIELINVLWVRYIKRYSDETNTDLIKLIRIIKLIKAEQINPYLDLVHSRWAIVKDYRLMNQERYLFNVEVNHINNTYELDNDHEHCVFCWTKFDNNNIKGNYVDKKKNNYICSDCFKDFTFLFYWKVI